LDPSNLPISIDSDPFDHGTPGGAVSTLQIEVPEIDVDVDGNGNGGGVGDGDGDGGGNGANSIERESSGENRTWPVR